MRLFLCGGGCGSQVVEAYREFNKQLSTNKPLLYIPLAMEEDKYDGCNEWFSAEAKIIGHPRFEMVRSAEKLLEKDFNEFCGIFIGGGNTYDLLNRINSAELRNKFETYLSNNGVIFGGSAGAIIFGRDIDVCKIEDGNNCGLKNTSGFNRINDMSILCHLNKKHFIRNMAHLKSLSYTQKIIYLAEEHTVFINNGEIHTFGNKDYAIFTNGKCYFKKAKNLKKEFMNKPIKLGHK